MADGKSPIMGSKGGKQLSFGQLQSKAALLFHKTKALASKIGHWAENSKTAKLSAFTVLVIITVARLIQIFSSGYPMQVVEVDRAESLLYQFQQLSTAEKSISAKSLQKAALENYRSFGHGGSRPEDWRSKTLETDEAARGILDSLIGEGTATVPCFLDESLPATPGRARVMFAADLHNNEHVLPHFMYQMVQIVAIMGAEKVFVSVYESGSTDDTIAWLSVLKFLLDRLGTRYRIVTGGTETRHAGQDRIGFLARVRNLALEPLWSTDPKVHFEADRIIFLNDVFFCARDVIRLLQHNADVACGMDFVAPDLDALPERVVLPALHKHLQRKYWLPMWLAKMVATSETVWKAYRSNTDNSEVYRQDAPMFFYDKWVAHDADGNAFDNEFPYVQHLYSQERLKQGLPFPVHCCWNGLVVFNAKPFVEQGLRFRMHEPNECAASECSIMCDDFKRLGYGNIIVDPGVRQAYEADTGLNLYSPIRVLGMPYVDWDTVKNSPPVDLTTAAEEPHVNCCFLKPGHDQVNFETDCKVVSPFRNNHTDSYMQSAYYEQLMREEAFTLTD